ncbi:MAG: prolyl aminopeptidase [Gammaproteobacteria bacterium]
MQKLFPSLEHYVTHDIPVDKVHAIHVREYGNQLGAPVIFLHGGPGSGCKPEHACYFNPKYYRIILFDQRGSGLSTPVDEIANNQTGALVEDIEVIRKHMKIERWLLFAGSWGATLGLVYAETYPACVTGLILRGVFLARQKDLDWFFGNDGVARLFPQAWHAYSAWLPEAEQENLIESYFNRLQSEESALNTQAAKAWSAWGDTIVTNGSVKQPPEVNDNAVIPNGLLTKTRIEAHYAKHHYFLSENYILEHIDQLPDVPVSIVHGKHDLVCPIEAAWTLHQVIPGSRLISVDSGHLASESEMAAALVNETERFAN